MKRWVALFGVCLASCGGGDVGVSNVSPQGSIGGIVVDGATRMPMADVVVRLYSGGETPVEVHTSANGEWALEDIDAGPVLVRMSKSGFANAQISANLAVAAGDFPLANARLTLGPIGLLPTTQTLTVRLVNENGEPMPGIKTVARTAAAHIDFSSGAPVGVGQIVASPAPSDASTGNVIIMGMPDFTGVGSVRSPSGVVDEVTIEVPAVDANMDGVFDFLSTTKVFSLLSLPPTPTIVVRQRSASLFVEASTIDAFESAAGLPGGVTRVPTVLPTTTSPIFITFNHPLDMMRTSVSLSDENGTVLSTQPQIMLVGSSTMRLTPPQGSMNLGQEYNLWVHAVAQTVDQNLEIDLAAPFFIAHDPNTSLTASVTRDVSVPGFLNLTFSEPVGIGSQVRLSGGNCVLFYAGEIGNLPTGRPPIGNDSGELGNPDCSNPQLFIEIREPDPIGPVGRSGYSRHWIMSDMKPLSSLSFHLTLSRVSDTSLVIERPSGEVVPDFVGARALMLPPNF